MIEFPLKGLLLISSSDILSSITEYLRVTISSFPTIVLFLLFLLLFLFVAGVLFSVLLCAGFVVYFVQWVAYDLHMIVHVCKAM